VAELQQRVADLESVVRQLREGRDSAAAQAPQAPVPAGDPAAPTATTATLASDQLVPGYPASPAASQPIPSFSNVAGWNDGFFMQSADGSFQLRITGQIQADYREFFQKVDSSTTANTAVAGSPTTGSPDTFLIRRARLGIEATMMDYYEFRLLPDFAGSSIAKSITDAYLNIHYWDEFQFEIGKFKQPFSYEELIQDRYVPTMERSMIDQLTPQRDEGAMIHGHKCFGDRFEYGLAISNGDQNDSTIDDHNNKDFNGRIDMRPFNDPEGWDLVRYFGIGISGGVGVEEDALGTTSSPSIITTPATVTWFAYNSGVLANGLRDRVSPEVTYFYHSFGFASQYFQENQMLQLSATKPIVDVPTNGYYVMATYLLTGEQRYDYTQQIDPIHPFDPNCPFQSSGAWEAVLRFERLAVGHEAFTAGLATDTAGSNNRSSPECSETTLGLNWYLNKWVRAQLNWEHANFDSPVKIGNAPKGFTVEDALYCRFQIIF
jgi:phosphate-selective porin OprO/OprP